MSGLMIELSYRKEQMGLIFLVLFAFNVLLLVYSIYRLKQYSLTKTHDYISAISHDLRTPLNAISGYTQLISLQEGINDKTKQYLKVINDSAHMMVGLIDEILDHSKLKCGKLTIMKEAVNLNDVIANVIQFNSVIAKHKHISLEVLTEDISENEIILGDSLRLKQIYNNIISNAIKFTLEGGVVVKFSKDKHFLYTDVSDTGKGMSEKETKRLFKKFSQANDTTFNEFGGSGLGLYVTFYLIQTMGGNISIESEEGIGTLVRICIPIKK